MVLHDPLYSTVMNNSSYMVGCEGLGKSWIGDMQHGQFHHLVEGMTYWHMQYKTRNHAFIGCREGKGKKRL